MTVPLGVLAVVVGTATLVALGLAYARLPRLLAASVTLAAVGAAGWAVSAGAAALVAPGLVVPLVAVQVVSAWGFVVAAVWATLLVTYRAYLLGRSLVVVGTVPPAVVVAALVVPATRRFVLDVEASGVAWGLGLWAQAVVSSLVMVVVAVALLVVAASTVPGQRPLVLRVVATTVPAAVAWLLFLAGGRPQALATATPVLLCLALGTWLVVALRRPGLVQLPITVSRLFAEVEDGVVVLDGSGRVLTSNAAARAMLSTRMAAWTTYADARLGPVPEPGTTRQVRTASGRVVELLADRLERPGHAPTVVVTARDVTELATVREHLQDVASRDAMTGVRNRRYLESRLPELLEQARGRFALSVVMLDVDRFKHVNDTYGHATGDRVIVGIADEACASLPPGAELVRMGGDEFAAVLPGTDLDAARRAADRIAARCARLRFASPSAAPSASPPVSQPATFSVTVSAGVHQADPWTNADELLRAADDALYAAKRAHQTAAQRGESR